MQSYSGFALLPVIFITEIKNLSYLCIFDPVRDFQNMIPIFLEDRYEILTKCFYFLNVVIASLLKRSSHLNEQEKVAETEVKQI